MIARVVELVDTLVLGTSTFGVRVRVPSLAIVTCESSSVVELHLAKVDVAGSSPVFRFMDRLLSFLFEAVFFV